MIRSCYSFPVSPQLLYHQGNHVPCSRHTNRRRILMVSQPVPSLDLNAIKARQQKTCATGDYSLIGTTLVIISEQLCESTDVHAGERVLDVATGSGNTALAAAR